MSQPRESMTIGDLINYFECLPVKVEEGETVDEALLRTEIRIRVQSSTGQYANTTTPRTVRLEKLRMPDKEVVVIDAGYTHDPD